MSGLLFSKPLYRGILVKRYKRFLADIVTESGENITIHCPNTGAMTGLTDPGTIVWFSGPDHRMLFVQDSSPEVQEIIKNVKLFTGNSLGDYCTSMVEKDVKFKKTITKRVYHYTWQMIEKNGLFIGINTQNPNRLIRLALMCKELDPFKQYVNIVPEFAVGHHRFDFLCENNEKEHFYIEVKNVHWRRPELEEDCNYMDSFPWAYFPDTISERAKNHVELLEELGKNNEKTALIYVVQREDCLGVQACKEKDLKYWEAIQHSPHISLYGYNCLLSPLGICLQNSILAK